MRGDRRGADSVRNHPRRAVWHQRDLADRPKEFIVGAGGEMSGCHAIAELVTTKVTISTLASTSDDTGGNGDIFVNDAVAWTA